MYSVCVCQGVGEMKTDGERERAIIKWDTQTAPEEGHFTKEEY